MTTSNTLPPENIITVQGTSLAVGGATVCEALSPERYVGKKAFIQYIVPGERAEVVPYKEKKSYFEGNLVSLLSRSDHRIDPPCPHFGKCGGCDLQHIELTHQRSLKRQMIEDALKHQGGLRASEGVTLINSATLPSIRYRRRMSFHLNRDGKFGLYQKNGRHIIELTECLISTDVVNSVLADYLPLIRGCAPEIETVTVEDHDGIPYVVLDMHPRTLDALATLREKDDFKSLLENISNLKVRFRHKAVYPPSAVEAGGDEIPVGHFSQNNGAANEIMIERVVELAVGTAVTDLYAGAGNLSIPMAQAGKKVTAVELNPALAAFGRSRAEKLGIADKLSFILSSCENWAQAYTPEPTCVLDPPRSGARGVAEKLSPDKTPNLVYVSCFPPTFIRDAQILVSRGYTLRSVEVLDMFPQTSHVELIAAFE